MVKVNFGFTKKGLAFWDHDRRTIAHAKAKGIKWFYDPGSGVKQKINRIAGHFESMLQYGNLTRNTKNSKK